MIKLSLLTAIKFPVLYRNFHNTFQIYFYYIRLYDILDTYLENQDTENQTICSRFDTSKCISIDLPYFFYITYFIKKLFHDQYHLLNKIQ